MWGFSIHICNFSTATKHFRTEYGFTFFSFGMLALLQRNCEMSLFIQRGLTPCSGVLDKLIFAQLVKFPCFHWTRRFITVDPALCQIDPVHIYTLVSLSSILLWNFLRKPTSAKWYLFFEFPCKWTSFNAQSCPGRKLNDIKTYILLNK